jgi:hypothetical protein
MKNKYVYKDKNTGRKVFSDVPRKDKNLVLVTMVKDGMMRTKEVYNK